MPAPALSLWRPTCKLAGALDGVGSTWACPRHDPVLERDCEECTERDRQRAARGRQEAEEIDVRQSFWDGVHETDAGSMPRLEMAAKLLAEGKGLRDVEHTLGAPTNTLGRILRNRGLLPPGEKRPRKGEPKRRRPLQVTPPTPVDPSVRDPLETKPPRAEARPDLHRAPAESSSHEQAAEEGSLDAVDTKLLKQFVRYRGLTSECLQFAGVAEWLEREAS